MKAFLWRDLFHFITNFHILPSIYTTKSVWTYRWHYFGITLHGKNYSGYTQQKLPSSSKHFFTASIISSFEGCRLHASKNVRTSWNVSVLVVLSVDKSFSNSISYSKWQNIARDMLTLQKISYTDLETYECLSTRRMKHSIFHRVKYAGIPAFSDPYFPV